jgi:hypothetical protein
MATQDNYSPGQERVQVTASPTLISEKARFDPQENVNRLLAAFGMESTQNELARMNQDHEARKLRDQQVKFDWYVEQFQKDHAGGAVSQAQIKERFPETVPVIASRIAEAVGHQEGKKQFQGVIDEIAANDGLRLDSTARAAFLAKRRAEITSTVGQSHDFYGAGMVSAIDKLVAQHEQNWGSETAAYHQKAQAEQFSGEVVEALNNGKPEALDGLDARYKASSSLNDLERKKLVVDTAIDLAFTNDDPEVLRNVPQAFLNAEHKAALAKAKVQLTDRRMADFFNAQRLTEVRRAEDRRTAKKEIIGKVVEGEAIDPAMYRDDDEKYQFALEMRRSPRIEESLSFANAQAVRGAILSQSTVGSMGSEEGIADHILANRELNPKEKQALIAELPKLIEGRNLMADDLVRQPVSDRLAPRLQALEQSTNSAIQSLLTGRNLRSEVMKGYDLDIRRSFMAEFEETGRWPTGHRKLELIDKAVDRAEKRLEDATRITGGSASPAANRTPQGAPKAAPAPAPTATPAAAPAALPKGVKLIN